MDDILVARQKEEGITKWVCSGIIYLSYGCSNLCSCFLWPIVFALACFIFDWCSNFTYYTVVENNPNTKYTHTKIFNILRIIAFFLAIISFLILYFKNQNYFQ